MAAQRLYDLTVLCKPSENEIDTILDVVLEDLEVIDSDLVRLVNSYPHKRDEKNSSLIRLLLTSWIKDSFLPVLSDNCRLLFLDLMFCNSWSLNMWKIVTLTLLSLIRTWIFLAKNVEELKNVFSNEPSLIYSKDFRNCIKHFLAGGKYDSAPKTTNIKKQNENDKGADLTSEHKKTQSVVRKLELYMNLGQAVGKITARPLETSISVPGNESEDESEDDVNTNSDKIKGADCRLQSNIKTLNSKMKMYDEKLLDLEKKKSTPHPIVEEMEKESIKINNNIERLEKITSSKLPSNSKTNSPKGKPQNSEKDNNIRKSAKSPTCQKTMLPCDYKEKILKQNKLKVKKTTLKGKIKETQRKHKQKT